jgi:hypothetical protein
MYRKISSAALLLLQEVIVLPGNATEDDYWRNYKEQLSEPGAWGMWMTGMGECLPYYENKITLSKDKKDKWEIPLVEIDCEYKAK